MRCPVCKADNVQASPCRRCKADLSLLFALEQQRQAALAEARRSLHDGEWQSATRHAEAASWLRGEEEARRLTAMAHLLAGDFAEAWRVYQRIRKLTESCSTES